MGMKKEMMNMVKRRKLEYLRHILRNDTKYKLLKFILQGKEVWLRNLTTWFSKATPGLGQQSTRSY
jgi:hypothetical protein